MLWMNDGWNDPLGRVPENINHLFGLVLNPMRGRTEECRLVAVSDYRHEIVDLVKRERGEPYKDGNWHKVFLKGGPLEWFNPPASMDGPADDWGQGIIELRRDGWRRVA